MARTYSNTPEPRFVEESVTAQSAESTEYAQKAGEAETAKSAESAESAEVAEKSNASVYLTEAPTEDNPVEGVLVDVVLEEEPATKYEGYRYYILTTE